MSREWDPEEALKSMELESQLEVAPDGSTDHVGTAQRLLLEKLPEAAMALAHLALWSGNEKIRLDAAKEILNRGLGRVTEAGLTNEENDPLKQFVAEFVHTVEAHANGE